MQVVVDASFDPNSHGDTITTQDIIFTAAKKHSSPHGKKIYIFSSSPLLHGLSDLGSTYMI